MQPKSQTLRSEYDDKSIMHYGGSKEGCRNSKEPYMVLKSTGKAIPDNKELSPLDIKFLKEVYAAPKPRNEFLLTKIIEMNRYYHSIRIIPALLKNHASIIYNKLHQAPSRQHFKNRRF